MRKFASSEDQAAAHSKFMKRYWRSSVRRDAMSAKLKGKPSPWKGKQLSEGHKIKIGLGVASSPKYLRAKRLGLFANGFPGDLNPAKRPEVAAKISAAHKGKVLSLEHRAKISQSLLGNTHTLGHRLTKEHRAKIKSRTRAAFKRDPTMRVRMSEGSKRNWSNPKYVQKVFKARAAKPNKAELKLKKILSQLFPHQWKYVGDGKMTLAGKVPDFVNVNGQKKIIELFGDYWHKGDSPKARAKLFKPFGYQTLIVWERELYDVERLERKLTSFA